MLKVAIRIRSLQFGIEGFGLIVLRVCGWGVWDVIQFWGLWVTVWGSAPITDSWRP